MNAIANHEYCKCIYIDCKQNTITTLNNDASKITFTR